MLKEIEIKGIQVFYYDCCITESQARKYATTEIVNNYQDKYTKDRLKCIFKDHSMECGI